MRAGQRRSVLACTIVGLAALNYATSRGRAARTCAAAPRTGTAAQDPSSTDMQDAIASPASPRPPAIRPGLLGALLTLLFSLSSIVFIEPAPYDLLAVLLFVVLVAGGLRFPRELELPALLLGIFVAGNCVAAITADDPLGTLRSLSIRVYMVVGWLFVVAVLVVAPRRMLAALWAGYLFAALVATAWGTLEYLGYLPGDQWMPGLRAKGPFKDPNVFGPFLVPPAVYALLRVSEARRGAAALWSGLFLVFCFGVLLSFSRGAWINLLLSVLTLLTLSLVAARGLARKLGWILTSVAMLAMAVAMLAAAVSTTAIGERFAQRAVLAQRYDLAEGGRFDTQRRAVAMIGRNPVGVGPGRSDDKFGLEPHNLYLHVFVEGGWLAGIALLTFIAVSAVAATATLRRRSTLRTELFAVAACLVGVLTQSLFIDSTHWRHMWLLFALLWALLIAIGRSRDAPQAFMSKAR